MPTDTLEAPAETAHADNDFDPHREDANELAETTSPDEPALSPDELRRLHYEEIVALGRRVKLAKSAWDGAKADAAESKKEYEGLLVQLLKLQSRDPMQRPLPLGESDEPLPPDDSWRRLEISVLDIQPNVVNKCFEYGIMTLGDLQDFWKSGKQLHGTVKGIGEASDTAVRDAFAKYGTDHPEVFGEPAAAATGADAGEIDPDQPDAE